MIDRALAKDRPRALAEYMAQFRTDIEGFVALEVVEACIGDYREQQAVAGITYRAFVDPSRRLRGQFHPRNHPSRHPQRPRRHRCRARSRTHRSRPNRWSADFAALCKSYHITKVTGDRYGGEFPRELFRKHGITYELSKFTKSELFRDLLPLLNSLKITLPRNARLTSQIVGLERRVAAGGRETITHPDHGHDDLANAVAGAAKLSRYGGYDSTWRWVSGPTKPPEDPKAQAEARATS